MTKPPPTNPRRATASSRSGGKARVKGRPYDEATKARAVARLEAEGMAATHHATGIPKGTLNRWAKAAGIDLGEQARARTAKATESVRARAAEVKLTTVDLLEQHLAQAGDYLSTVAGINALAAQLITRVDGSKLARVALPFGGTAITIDDAQVDEVLKVAEALGSLPLAVRDAEGILTRAIHDLQLLKGEATERGELVVEFAVPRPTASPDPVPEYDTQE